MDVVIMNGLDKKYGIRKCLRDRLNNAAEISPWSFWESPTVEELARLQNISPIEDVSVLYGTWPGEPNDRFEEAIDELRHGSVHKDGGS